MSRRLFLLAALLLSALVWFLWPRHDEDEGRGATSSRPEVQTPLADQSKIKNQKSKILLPAPPAETSSLARALNSPATTIQSDLRILQACLENYRTNFPRDGNPVGSNAEITAALIGRNPLRHAVIPPDHSAINRTGELCDRWGTPFFFHAESGTRMTITSAGPDKKFHTPDDVELTP